MKKWRETTKTNEKSKALKENQLKKNEKANDRSNDRKRHKNDSTNDRTMTGRI